MLNLLDFSVILGFQIPGLNRVFRLRRYNGKSHYHTNVLEKTPPFRDFHIHTATERYQRAPGHKEDHFATIDKRYYDFESAVTCMLGDCGFRSPIEDAPLFSGITQ